MSLPYTNKSRTTRQGPIPTLPSQITTFTMVHYSPSYSYLTDPSLGQYPQITKISLIPEVIPFCLKIYQLLATLSLNHRTPPNQPQLQQSISRSQIVQIVGQDISSLASLVLPLPQSKPLILQAQVITQQNIFSGIFEPVRTQHHKIQLHNKQNTSHIQLSFEITIAKISLPSKQDEEPIEEQIENQSNISQPQGGQEGLCQPLSTRLSPVKQPIEQEILGSSRWLSKEKQRLTVARRGERRSSQYCSEDSFNEFLGRKSIQQFSFIQRDKSQDKGNDSDDNLPIKQAKTKHFLPELLEQAIARSQRTKKSDHSNESPTAYKSSAVAQGELESFNQRQMNRYKQLLQHKQSINNKLRLEEKNRESNKYDYRPKTLSDRSEEKQTISGEVTEDTSCLGSLKTPFISKIIQGPLSLLQARHTNTRRGYTDKYYLQKFTKAITQPPTPFTNKPPPIIAKETKGTPFPDQPTTQIIQPRSVSMKQSLQNKIPHSRKPGFITYQKNRLGSSEYDSDNANYHNEQANRRQKHHNEQANRRQKHHNEQANRRQKQEAIQQELVEGRRTNKGRSASFKPYRQQRLSTAIKQTSNPAATRDQNFIRCSENSRHLGLSSSIVHLNISSLNPNPIQEDNKNKGGISEENMNLQRVVDVPMPAQHHHLPSSADLVASPKDTVYMPTSLTKAHLQQKDTFDIIIKNISVNLYTKNFGRKFIELSLDRILYTTDLLHGSHLLWVARGYLFPNAAPSQKIQITLKSQKDHNLHILGRTNLSINDFLMNYRQLFCQSYIFTPNSELLAVIIVGFQISPGNPRRASLGSGQCRTDHKSHGKKVESIKFPKTPSNYQQQNQHCSKPSQIQIHKGAKLKIAPRKKSKFVTQPRQQQSDAREWDLASDLKRLAGSSDS